MGRQTITMNSKGALWGGRRKEKKHQNPGVPKCGVFGEWINHRGKRGGKEKKREERMGTLEVGMLSLNSRWREELRKRR